MLGLQERAAAQCTILAGFWQSLKVASSYSCVSTKIMKVAVCNKLVVEFVKNAFDRSIDLRATSHTRLRARDHYISSTLIGGQGRAGPSSLHTIIEGPMEYVKSTRIPTWHRMDHVSWSFGLFSKTISWR